IFQIFDGIQCIGIGILRGLTDVRIPVIYAFITYIVINLPLGYLLAFPLQMGASGIWVAFSISLCMAAVLYHVRWRRKWNSLSKTYDQTSPLGIF
ncbi:MAG: polysaccharide biosynthesis C-terminal domain-containing protein, partial [Paludibacteraceae bacterium]|nr:polysaccharide biosynthesis C-terminal domain-containing protein [Paludibacteraceae bacterium]